MYDNLADVESDLSAFHRIDDVRAVQPQRLIDFAVRLSAYAGVVQARHRLAALDEQDAAPGFTGSDEDRVVDSDATSLQVDPVLGALIDFG